MGRLAAGWMVCLVLGGMPRMVSAQAGSVGGPAVTLEKTVWRLTQLGGAAVTVDDPKRRPYLELDPVAHRASGSGGCNRVTGPYQLTGNQVTFSGMASTRMMCPSGMDLEQRFLKTLNGTKRWRIEGQELKFMDGEGKVVAVFEVSPAAG